jgi:ABC-2 type transport system ATP-binding protein
MNLAVQTSALTKKYEEKTVVDNLNLQVEVGSVFVLLGTNGAGKSTVLRMLAGLKRPTSGSGRCLGLDITSPSVEFREKISYMGEEPSFYNYLHVGSLVSLCRGFYRRWDDRLVERYLEEFSIDPGVKVGELSQGMKNQLALILAMAPRPELLILDEPTTGFDPVKRRLSYNALLEEFVAEGKTVLLASHQVQDVERIADQVGFLREGSLVYTCAMEELRAKEKEIRVVFQKEPPRTLFQRPGVEKVEKDGAAYRVFISDHLEEIWEECASLPHYTLEVTSLDLEEVFLRHMGGEGQ